jgi:hypothetical protein
MNKPTSHKKAVIISGFAGIGKTTAYKKLAGKATDSDSSNFSWALNSNGEQIKDEQGKPIRNPNFPANYINHIKQAQSSGNYDYIFVSSHDIVRQALIDNGLQFNLVYPDIERQDEFVQRYKDRGSPAGFINLVKANWKQWINECEELNNPLCNNIRLDKGYLSDYLFSAEVAKNLDKMLPTEVEYTLQNLAIAETIDDWYLMSIKEMKETVSNAELALCIYGWASMSYEKMNIAVKMINTDTDKLDLTLKYSGIARLVKNWFKLDFDRMQFIVNHFRMTRCIKGFDLMTIKEMKFTMAHYDLARTIDDWSTLSLEKMQEIQQNHNLTN